MFRILVCCLLSLSSSLLAAEGAMTAALPLDVIAADGKDPFVPSGYMGNHSAIQVTRGSDGGSAMLTITYSAAGDWYGIAWLYPANDWGQQAGHWNLSGATRLHISARGKAGGEKVKFQFGLLKDSPHVDSAQAEGGEHVLSTEWQEFTIDLSGKDLSHMKCGFAVFGGGNGASQSYDLKDVRFE